MLSVCAAQVVQAVGWPLARGARAVSYIGWNAYGAPLQVNFTGSQRMWRNLFWTLAVMSPRSPVVTSSISVKNPCAVSCIETRSVSPGFMSSTSRVGVNVFAVCLSGPGGPTGLPLWVRKAKLTGSGQLGFASALGGLPGPWRPPKFAWRLSIVSAAHQWTWSQEMTGAYPGGYIWSSMNAAPAWSGRGGTWMFESLSGMQIFVPSG